MQLKAHESRSRRGRRPALAALTVLTISFVGAVTYGAASAAGPASSPAALGVTATSEPDETIPVDTADAGGSEASPTPPTGLGDDPDLDALAESCFEGELVDCDHLFLQAPTGSPYEDYGDTCGGRQPAGTEEWCALTAHTVEPQPPDGLGDDATLNTLAERCYEGDLQACDDLYSQSDSSSPYHVYGDTCAGRQPENTGHYCTDLAPVGTAPVSSEPASTSEPTTPETAPPSTAPATTEPVTTEAPVTAEPTTSAPATTQPVVAVPSSQPTMTAPIVTVPVTPATTAAPTTTPIASTTVAVVPTTVAGVPPATQPPTGLGTDPTMDALAQSCFAGDMQACDDLYYQSPIGSAYEAYGTSCAGRSTSDIPGSCVSTFAPEAAPTTVANLPPAPAATQPPTGLGTDPAMDALAQSCFAGDMQSCDELYSASPIGSAYEAYAETCAGRTESFVGMCSATFASTSAGPAPTTVPPGPTTVPAVPTTVAVPTPPTTVVAVPASIPPATQQPTGLGTDTTLDAMAQSCFAGDMSACDNLFFAAPANSAYEAYGDTCAGRQPPFSGLCVDAFGSPATVPATTAPAVTSTTAPVVTAVPPTTAPAVTVTPTSLVPATTVVPGVVPPPTLQPTGLGDDAALNALAQGCFDGNLASCDDLWRQSELGTPYKDFGDTCAGRQPPNTSVWCVDAFGAATGPSTTAVVAVPPTVSTVVPTVVSGIPPAAQPPTGLGADAALDVLAQGCFDGDMGACDRLFKLAPIGSAYETYGDTCAGRQPEGTFTYCRAAFPG